MKRISVESWIPRRIYVNLEYSYNKRVRIDYEYEEESQVKDPRTEPLLY